MGTSEKGISESDSFRRSLAMIFAFQSSVMCREPKKAHESELMLNSTLLLLLQPLELVGEDSKGGQVVFARCRLSFCRRQMIEHSVTPEARGQSCWTGAEEVDSVPRDSDKEVWSLLSCISSVPLHLLSFPSSPPQTSSTVTTVVLMP